MIKKLSTIFSLLMLVQTGLWAQATTGAALNFNGSNNYITIPDNARLNFGSGDFTIEADFQSSASQPDYAGIVAKDGSASSGLGWQLVIVGNNIAAEFTDGNTFFGPGNLLQGSVPLNDGNWHHLAMVVTNSSITLYVDGTVDTYVSDPAIGNMDISNPAAPLLIGVDRTTSIFANGNIDEVKIWNIAHTQTAIQNNMNCMIVPNAAGLVAYYNFDNGIPNGNNTVITTVPDVTTNANTGTLKTFTLTGTSSNFVDNVPFSVQVTTTITATSNTVCAGTPVTLTAATPTGGTSPYMYTWNPGGTAGSSATLTNTTTITPSATSTVTAVKKWWALVSDANGCAFTNDTVAVQVNSLPIVTIDGAATYTMAVCMGATGTLTASGATTYTWMPSNLHTTTISGPVTAPIIFTLTGTDANNCVSLNPATATVSVNALPTVTITASSATVCAGVTTTLTASGATSYTWTSGPAATTYTVAPANTIQYTVTGIDANNCTNTDTLSIQVTNCTTGISQYSNLSTQISVYPNPNNGTFVITTSEDAETILVCDLLGNVLLTVHPNGTSTNINLAAQPNGIYFIKVLANSTQSVKQIIISN